jgi:protein-tyrosine phosphatase
MADLSWITDRLAVGGGLWRRENLEEVLRAGVTHIINTQVEFDDRALVREGDRVEILQLAMDDDFQPKSSELLARAGGFGRRALAQPQAKLLVHCASGVHRAPLVVAAILCAHGFSLSAAVRLVESRRPQADFPAPYLDSVAEFLADWEGERAADAG